MLKRNRRRHTPDRWQMTAILKGRVKDDIYASFFIVLYYFYFSHGIVLMVYLGN